MNKKIKISVVMATYNEEKSIENVVNDIKKYTLHYETEILIVDSSKDKTPQIAKKLGVKVISQPPRGHAFALKTGIDVASGDYIITADCDNTYPMYDIPRLMAIIESENQDIISCNRLTRRSSKRMKMANRIGNRLAAMAVRLLFWIDTHDVSTGMFCIKRNVIKKLNLKAEYDALPAEIIIKSKLNKIRYQEIDIDYMDRVGSTKLNFKHTAKQYLFLVFKLWFNRK